MTTWTVRQAGAADFYPWLSLRQSLWPHVATEAHRAEVEAALQQPDRLVAFLCLDETGQVVGLAEASIRTDYVNGCTTSPVAFLEGIVVDPMLRRQGVAGALTAAVCDWARSRGLSELASDASLDNSISHAMHEALGFEETQRVVYFRKTL
jgi:aminoglycoside 6'-N-acetyltransferase I